jgi:hypothetical protein
LVTLCASANAATVHRAKPHEGHLRPAPRDTLPKGFAVPGWTDEQTRQCACPANTAAAGDKRKTAQVGVPMM